MECSIKFGKLHPSPKAAMWLLQPLLNKSIRESMGFFIFLKVQIKEHFFYEKKVFVLLKSEIRGKVFYKPHRFRNEPKFRTTQPFVSYGESVLVNLKKLNPFKDILLKRRPTILFNTSFVKDLSVVNQCGSSWN